MLSKKFLRSSFRAYVNLLNLAIVTRFKDGIIKHISHISITIFMFYSQKNNYFFVLPSLLLLSLFTKQAVEIYQRERKGAHFTFWIFIMLAAFVVLYFLNRTFDLNNYLKQFINPYMNTETMERRGRTLLNVVSTILPDIFNLFWLLCLFYL